MNQQARASVWRPSLLRAPAARITAAGPAAVLVSFAVLCFLAYLQTMSPTITEEHWGIDSGEMAVAAYRLTVPHPSGYPTYLVLGHLFSLLPFGSLAYRLNLMSATFGMLTIAVLAWSIYSALSRANLGWGTRALGAVAGGGLFAFSPTFWSQAILAEVYTLHTFLVIALIRLLLAWDSRAGQRRPLIAGLAITFGLGMGNHTTIALVLPAVLGFVLPAYVQPASPWGRFRRIVLDVTVALFAFMVAVSLYAVVMVRAQQGAYPSLWDPSTPATLLDHVAGGSFRRILFAWPEVVLSRLLAIPRLLILQHNPAGVATAMAGLWMLALYYPRLLVFFALATVPVVYFAVNYPVFDSQVYLFPLSLLVALAAGCGVALTLHLANGAGGALPANPARRIAYAGAIVLALSLPPIQFWLHRGWADLSDNWKTHARFTRLLDRMPANALLITGYPGELYAVWYLQYAEDYRPDVLVIDAFWLPKLESYRKNLARHFPEVVPPVNTPDYFGALAEKNAGTRAIMATFRAKEYLAHLPLRDYDDGLIEVRADRPHSAAAGR